MTNFCGLILCAGYGNRLQQTGYKLPKPMIAVNKKSIINYIVDNFIKNDITKIVFVLWYKEPLLLNHLEQIKKEYLKSHEKIDFFYLINNNLERENGYSSFLGLNQITVLNIGEKIVLSMGDHLYSQKFISKLLSKDDNSDIVIGTDPFINDDKIVNGSTTKILGKKNKVITIGKNINEFNRIDTGIFLVKSTILRVVQELEQRQFRFGWTDVVKLGIEKKYTITFADFEDIPWFNINYKNDLFRAEEFVKKHNM
ncbi:MAG: hypothetical protein HZR80_10505 [Candidatus Heimdallarchaeota archaeon]